MNTHNLKCLTLLCPVEVTNITPVTKQNVAK